MSGSVQARNRVNVVITYLVMGVIGILILLPFFWMISTSFKPNPEILTREVRLFPVNPTLEQYEEVFQRIPYWINLFNSTFVSAFTTAIAIFFSTMTGYGISKYRSRGLNVIFMFILTALMIPPFLIAIPLYLAAAGIGVVNSL